MDFDYSVEQDMLRDTLASYLADHYDFETRGAVVATPAGWRPKVWADLAERLNLLGAAFPEEYGGLGGGALENAVVMEELGKALVVEPYLGTVVIGGGLLKQVGGALAAEWLPRIIAGQAVLAFAYSEPQARYSLAEVATTATKRDGGYVLNGRKTGVTGGPWASQLLVTARSGEGISLLLVDADAQGLTRSDYPTIDGGRASDITFHDVFVPAERLLGAEGAALPLVERAADEAICALCAEAVGGMRRMLADTVAYASQRKQFGVALATFQVLQHRMADMFTALEQSAALTLVATMKLDRPAAERALVASAAKAQVGKAAKLVGQAAVQIHGGMGITEELALGHYFRRATAIGSQFGSTDFHLRRYADLSLADAA
ncbi:pimeloyl-CoA dehydrogenase small subunit [Solimonas sp. K1W22B-7]|uniref:acyl-CoA dehydrogenase family protein n=1 Tax=Solimonas sp. K1W22B-7 TaxID=2303331 RepID=UPI000E334E97|nr:acyl-CoA dehydrogenase family protein [Solimonas sp. K1W22B-7]AXQ29330.1 pimeloyl-CoA dehydrogenase small subunit [Solimonas sp. K1W22B-7]